MPAYAALLRGINVSGQKRMGMADLKKSFEALGFQGVRTYLQSGNVVFQTASADPQPPASIIKNRLAGDFDLDVEVLVVSPREIDRVAKSNPLFPRLGTDETLFHATFLFRPVSKAAFLKLKLPAQPGEQAVRAGRVIYLYCPNGYGRTKLNNNFFEKAAGVPATTRNWRTVLALKALCAEP